MTGPVAGMGVIELAHIMSGPLSNVLEARPHPQALARDMIVETEDPGAGRIKGSRPSISASGLTRAPK